MILQVFAIEDVKAALFNVPFTVRSLGEALRAFSDLANDANSRIAAHPGDYRLVRLGTFNDEDASFVTHAPESMGCADQFVNVKVTPIGMIPGKGPGLVEVKNG